MDWVFDFSYDLSVPEYYVTHRECGVCKIAQQEGLMFLMPHMCVMDYPVEGVKFSWLTKLYIKSKRDKYFIVHAEFLTHLRG